LGLFGVDALMEQIIASRAIIGAPMPTGKEAACRALTVCTSGLETVMRSRRGSSKKTASWLTMGTELAMLGVEAQTVIGQRMAMFMLGGPKARKEARLMVTEKVKAAGEAAVTLATGGSPRKVVRSYQRKVQANQRRLSKG